MRSCDKLVVVGVGLIGGSFALALRTAGGVREVVGVGRGQGNLDRAIMLGIVDRALRFDEPWLTELRGADLVFLATPVAQMPALFAAMAPVLDERTVVTDAGSTKCDVIAAARAGLGGSCRRFVPGHPIAGAEATGADAASAALFRQRTVVLTPVEETEAAAVDAVKAWWERCGALVQRMTPERHDQVFAAVSHLPHALAFTLVAELAARPDADEYFQHAASGFRDFTRLASSSPEMWRDICLANRDALRLELAAFRLELGRLDALLEQHDRAGLEALFARAQTARDQWLERRAASA